MFPDSMTVPLADWVNSGIDWVVVNYGDYFEAFANNLLVVMVGLEQFLRNLLWWLVVLAVASIGCTPDDRREPSVVCSSAA